jgi:hypothetical protein
LDSHRKRLSEEEQKCQTQFECSITELPSLIENFKTEAETTLAKAECILGLREEEQPVVEEPPKVKPVIRKVKLPAQDEDGLV